ncbi:hypothetical protein, partial [Methanobrevibacter cuticularis]|uniref:hypothetical protein n=1 Tax=Methanobrevibacter cuticularis TaxID=47311 RepID=UPI000AF2EB90
MKLEKPVSPINTLDDLQYKFCVPESYTDFENSRKYSVDKSVYMIEEGKFAYKYPFCKHCHSRDLIKWDFNPKMIIGNDGKQYDIQVQRYRCKNCGKLSQTEFHDEYGPYSNFSKETKNKT